MRAASTEPAAPTRDPQPDATPGHLPGLDGVRAVAVLAVLVFHAGFGGLPGGFLGVDVFFALSGFLITGILVRRFRRGTTRADRPLADFWLRRARRLFPALFLVVLAVSAYRLFLLYGEEAATWGVDIIMAIAYATNWLEIARGQDYFTQWLDPSPLLQTWSLSIEEQFYIAIPLVLLVAFRVGIRRIPLIWLLAAAAIASASWMAFLYQEGASPERLYFGTDTRAQALLIGAALGATLPTMTVTAPSRLLTRSAGIAGWIGLAGLFGLFLTATGDSPWLYQGGFLLTAVLSLAVVLGCVLPATGGVPVLLSWGPLVFVGKISYGVYLWHWPVFLWVGGEPGVDPTPAQQLIRFALTFALAISSYYLVESYFRGKRFTTWPVRRQWTTFAAAAAALVALAMLPTVRDLTLQDRLPGQWPAAQQLPRTTFLAGDSAAVVLAGHYPLERYPDSRLISTLTLGCGVGSPRFFRGSELVDATPQCGDWAQNWRDRLGAEPVQRSIVMLSIWDLFDRELNGQPQGPGTEAFRRSLSVGLREAISVASRDGQIPVDVWGFPCFDTVLPQQLYLNDRERIDTANAIAADVVVGIPGARWVDLRPATCGPAGALTEVGGQEIRQDGIHWTEFGAAYMWQRILTDLAESSDADRSRIEPPRRAKLDAG